MKNFTLLLLFILYFYLPDVHSQLYNVTLNGALTSRGKSMECHTHVKLTYYYSSGRTRYKEIIIPHNFREGTYWRFSENFTTNERITAVKCVGVHADNPTGPQSCYTVDQGSDYKSISESDYPCVNIRLANRLIGKYDGGSYVYVTVEPADIQISYHNSIQYGNDENPGTNYLHENIPITIKATTGFPANVYKWEYSIGNTYSWTSLDNRYINSDKTEITLKATDLLSYEQIMYKTPVYIRINCNCGEFKTSNRIDLQPKIAAPTFKRVISKRNESCPGNADGEIVVEFNRNLFPEERIEILGKDEESGFFFSMDQEITGGNICRLYNLPPGTLNFQIKGSYIDHHGDTISTGIVTGNNEYSFIETIEAGNPPILRVIDFGNPTCPFGNDGWIAVTGEGGSGEYKLFCENNNHELFQSGFYYSEIRLNNLTTGEYDVWIEDSNGCISNIYEEKIIISNPENPIEVNYISLFNPVEGENTGSISVSVKKGTPPYQAIWRNEGASGTIINSNIQSGGVNNEISILRNLARGTYYVEFTDANGCKTNETILLTALPAFDITITQTATISCYGNHEGALSAIVNAGGSGIYTRYEWFYVDDYLGYHSTGENSPVISNISGGKYRMKVTDSEGNQSWSGIFIVTQPEQIEVSFSSNILKCRGDEDGVLSANISGGAGNYSWHWETGASGTGGYSEIDNLSAGIYSLSVTDGNGCQDHFSGTVNEPAPLSVSARETPPTCQGMDNGNIQLSISGGTPAYSILWSNGSTNSMIQNLSSGDYSVTVTDLYECETIQKSFSLSEPDELIASILQLSNVSENGRRDGKVVIRITGGSIPYRAICKDDQNITYPVPGTIYHPEGHATIEIRNLPEGNYTVFIQDRFYQSNPGNTYQSCAHTISFSISEPPPLLVSVEESHHISCNNGNDGVLSVQVSGGVPFETGENYHYKWYQMRGNNRIFIEGSENQVRMENLSAGSYLVEVIDQNSSTFSSTHTLTNPQAIRMTFQSAILACASDSSGWVTANVSGGDGAFSYLWSTGESGVTRIENKPGGWYILSVVDSRGCEVSDSTFISSPRSIQIQYDLQPPLCDGHGDASISIIVSGGEAPYSHRWSNGDTTAYLENIYPGSYTVRITDDLGCYRDTTFVVPEVSPVTVNLEDVIQPRAFGYSDGKIKVRISGGSLPYSITWENDLGNLVVSETYEEDGMMISVINDIPEGNYHLYVTDNNYQHIEQPSPFPTCGCLYEEIFYLPQPPKLEISIENTSQIRCFGTNDGAFVAHASGGVQHENGSPYTYQWFKNNHPIGSNDSTLSGLGEGVYHVKITDANGISVQSEQIFLDEPEKLTITTSATDLRCSLDTNGWAEAEASGGIQPYHFLWSNGETTSRIENISKGKYFVFVTDANGCEMTANAAVIQPDGITAEVQMTPPTCYNGSNGSISVRVRGGEAPYFYQWQNGNTNPDLRNIPAGNYSITITDVNQCSHEIFTYELTHPDSIVVDLGKDVTLCNGQRLELRAESEETITNYAWYNQLGVKLSNKQEIVLENPGIYRVEIITNKACKGAGSIKIDRDQRIIANDFLVASQVPINDEVFIINISEPLSDKIEWILPENEGVDFEIINSDENTLKLLFKRYGNFSIGMTTFSGKCSKTVYKSIFVTDKENISNYEDADEPVLRSFNVFPNPSSGYFEVHVEVKDNTPIYLQLVNSGSGKILERRYLKGKKLYTESFNISKPEKGTYIMNVYTPHTKSAKKIILK